MNSFKKIFKKLIPLVLYLFRACSPTPAPAQIKPPIVYLVTYDQRLVYEFYLGSNSGTNILSDLNYLTKVYATCRRLVDTNNLEIVVTYRWGLDIWRDQAVNARSGSYVIYPDAQLADDGLTLCNLAPNDTSQLVSNWKLEKTNIEEKAQDGLVNKNNNLQNTIAKWLDESLQVDSLIAVTILTTLDTLSINSILLLDKELGAQVQRAYPKHKYNFILQPIRSP